MLTHIVCFKYKDATSEAVRVDHRAKLAALVGVVPEIVTFAVGADMLHLDRSFDTGLVATFADADALERYTMHPVHLEIAALGREISERAVSVDFISD